MEAFDIRLYNPDNGDQQLRHWRQDELIRAMRWLKRLNARGYDIEIAPRGEHGLIMLDEVSQDQLAAFSRNGDNPALVTETEANVYQVWIKLSDGPVPEPVRDIVTRALTMKIRGDAIPVSQQPCGRLAGFTNHAAAAREDGQQPYVLVRESSGAVARRGKESVREVQRLIRQQIEKRPEYQREQKSQARRDRSRGPER